MNTKAHLQQAGHLGGVARVLKYGNPGTAVGRKKGGMNSLATHRAKKTRFKTLRAVKFPGHTEKLAELLGIFMGDGHVGEYQATVVTNSDTDYVHAQYVQQLIAKLFRVPTKIRKLSTSKACIIVVSSKEVCRFLKEQGMNSNKVLFGVTVPAWIKQNELFSNAFVRGLFDTDGCVFLDTHKIKGRTYKHLGIAFTNRTQSLTELFNSRLVELGLHPTQTSRFAVFLRREAEIKRYFGLIGTSNPKHRRRFSEFLRIRNGGVA